MFEHAGFILITQRMQSNVGDCDLNLKVTAGRLQMCRRRMEVEVEVEVEVRHTGV